MLIYLEIKHHDFLPKPGTSLPTVMISCFSPQLLLKPVTPSITNVDVTFPQSPSHRNCPISAVSLLESVLSRPICFKLSTYASKVKTSYNCCKSVVRKTLPAAPVDTFCRTLIIFSFSVLPRSHYANLSLALQSAPCCVTQLLGLSAKFRCFFILRKGLGSTIPQSSHFKYKNNAVCCADC